MATKHPESDLVPYLRNELAPPDRDQVTSHLEECPDCRQTVEEFGQLLSELGQSIPEPPPLHWGHFQAELRERLSSARERAGVERWWWRPASLTLAAGMVAILLLFTMQGGLHQGRPADDLMAFEEAVIGSRLELLRQNALVEKLDLLEDLEVIRQLDRLSTRREG